MNYNSQRPPYQGDTKLSEIAIDTAVPLYSGSAPQQNAMITQTVAFQALLEIARRQNILFRSDGTGQMFWDGSTLWWNAGSVANTIDLDVLATESSSFPAFTLQLVGSTSTNGPSTFMSVAIPDANIIYLEIDASQFVGMSGSPFPLQNAINGGGITVGKRVLMQPLTTAMPQLQIGSTLGGSLFYIPLVIRHGTDLFWVHSGLRWPQNTTSPVGYLPSLSNPMTAVGDLIYGGTLGSPQRLPAGTAGQYLATDGTSGPPAWTSFQTPQVATLSGSGTYTAPTGALYVRVQMCGGGGGGGASSSGGGGGGNTTFSDWTAQGGQGGARATNSTAGFGGGGLGVTVGTGTLIAAVNGASGSGGTYQFLGGKGGDTPFFSGGGGSPTLATNGGTAQPGFTGSSPGAGGSGETGQGGVAFAAGGGASGAYAEFLISSPTSYSYSVGGGGGAGSGGPGGGPGAAGTIIVTAYFS